MDIKSTYQWRAIALAIVVFLFASGSAYADTDNAHADKQTFVLSLWAPDEVAPAEAKLAEFGDSYSYQYSPDVIEFEQGTADQVIEFKFDKSLSGRYQFRWLTADYPQYTTLSKMKPHKMNVKLSEMPVNQDIYFEVWVLDTETGKVFMCDPQIRNRGSF